MTEKRELPVRTKSDSPDEGVKVPVINVEENAKVEDLAALLSGLRNLT